MESIVGYTLLGAMFLSLCRELFKHLYGDRREAYHDNMNRLNDLYTWSLVMSRCPPQFTLTKYAELLSETKTFMDTTKLTRHQKHTAMKIMHDTIINMALRHVHYP